MNLHKLRRGERAVREQVVAVRLVCLRGGPDQVVAHRRVALIQRPEAEPLRAAARCARDVQ